MSGKKIPQSIYRRKNVGREGWLVRLHYGDGQETKYFSDSAHDGEGGALQAATDWLDALLAERPAPLLVFARDEIASNTSGHNGLSITHTIGRDGEEIPCINVSFTITPGRPQQKRFYIHHFESEAAAIQEAVEFRRLMELNTIRHRKLRRLRPFDSNLNFCLVPTCPYRIPIGETHCKHHKGGVKELQDGKNS